MPPQVTIVPVDSVVQYGESVNLTCTATGYPAINSIIWNTTANINISAVTTDTTQDSSVIIFESVSLDHIGDYTCIAVNYKEGHNTTSLDVFGKFI